tara:strand:- start:29097 stop:29777 length:681 start_codon:yes stop_codon:yes gene_type:complete
MLAKFQHVFAIRQKRIFVECIRDHDGEQKHLYLYLTSFPRLHNTWHHHRFDCRQSSMVSPCHHQKWKPVMVPIKLFTNRITKTLDASHTLQKIFNVKEVQHECHVENPPFQALSNKSLQCSHGLVYVLEQSQFTVKLACQSADLLRNSCFSHLLIQYVQAPQNGFEAMLGRWHALSRAKKCAQVLYMSLSLPHGIAQGVSLELDCGGIKGFGRLFLQLLPLAAGVP